MLSLNTLHLAGLAAMAGALIYAVGDVLLLSARVNMAEHPRLAPHTRLLSGAEKMAALSWPRLMWGGLLGVLATPLLLFSLWPLYAGLAPAGGWAVWPVVGLFGLGFVIAPFVHGSFVYLGEYVQALERVSADSQTVILAMFKRHKQLLTISYGVVAIAILAASLWFSAAVALGATRFPLWLAAVNPLTILLGWLGVRRLLPRLGDALEGAGFNIAFLIFFTLVTFSLR